MLGGSHPPNLQDETRLIIYSSGPSNTGAESKGDGEKGAAMATKKNVRKGATVGNKASDDKSKTVTATGMIMTSYFMGLVAIAIATTYILVSSGLK